MVRTCKVIVKTKVFEGFEGCVRERERYQKNIKNETKKHHKIDKKIMLEKGVTRIPSPSQNR